MYDKVLVIFVNVNTYNIYIFSKYHIFNNFCSQIFDSVIAMEQFRKTVRTVRCDCLPVWFACSVHSHLQLLFLIY